LNLDTHNNQAKYKICKDPSMEIHAKITTEEVFIINA
jgi:hypothetical protein